MSELVYEFSSVYDKEGNSKLDIEKHANPVHISFLVKGLGAILSYADRPEEYITTSKVESIYIHQNSVNIVTENSDYWLKPYIREVQ